MTTTMAASFAADERKFNVWASDRYFLDIIDKVSSQVQFRIGRGDVLVSGITSGSTSFFHLYLFVANMTALDTGQRNNRRGGKRISMTSSGHHWV